jgi:hypothetical protein
MTKEEKALQAAVNKLFTRYPALCGFAVQKHGYRFSLSELAVLPSHDADLPALLEGEIALTIADFLLDRPQAVSLITGRTFARSLH